MAHNQYVNKVELGNQTIIDISDTTATASDVVSGKKLYTASGEPVNGSLVLGTVNRITNLSIDSAWTASNAYLVYTGNVGILVINGLKRNATVSAWSTAITLPTAVRSIPTIIHGSVVSDSSLSSGEAPVAEARINTSGEFQIYNPIANKLYWGSIVFMFNIN